MKSLDQHSVTLVLLTPSNPMIVKITSEIRTSACSCFSRSSGKPVLNAQKAVRKAAQAACHFLVANTIPPSISALLLGWLGVLEFISTTFSPSGQEFILCYFSQLNLRVEQHFESFCALWLANFFPVHLIIAIYFSPVKLMQLSVANPRLKTVLSEAQIWFYLFP